MTTSIIFWVWLYF